MDVAAVDRARLTALRKGLDFTQAEMAEALGLSRRAYNTLENGPAEVRKIHLLAAERATLRAAATRGAPRLAARAILDDMKGAAAEDLPFTLGFAITLLSLAHNRIRVRGGDVAAEALQRALFHAIEAEKALGAQAQA